MVGKAQKLHGVRSELNCVQLGKVDQWNPIKHPPYSPDLVPCDFCLGFPNHEKGAPRQEISVINGLQHIFEKWVEHCKKCIAFQGRYFEKETITTPP
jgi:hypothetical protein